MGKENISQHQRETFYSGRRKLFPVGWVYVIPYFSIIFGRKEKFRSYSDNIGKINQSAKDRAGEALKKSQNLRKIKVK